VCRRPVPGAKEHLLGPRYDSVTAAKVPIPTLALPGTPNKIDEMCRRAANFEELFDPNDVVNSERRARVVAMSRRDPSLPLRNGKAVVVGEVREGVTMTVSPTAINKKTIGGRIRLFRKRRCWTQMKLARKTGIAQSYISEIENDLAELSLRIVLTLANAFGVPIDYLIGRRPPKNFDL
jgi:DNA-binding XRE family transcriptional regulator